MKIIFYSEHCEYCKKMLAYLEKHNITSVFKLIDINSNNNIPKEIDIVPTIIDSELNQPLKGKQAFEYLLNIKYFNSPTNNISYLNSIQTPNIVEDKMANNLSVPNMASTNEKKTGGYDDTNSNIEQKENNNDINESLKFYEKNILKKILP